MQRTRHASAAASDASSADPHAPGRGDTNQNPRDVGLLELLAEDLRTHDGKILTPGFVAIAVHRFGNWRMDLKPKIVRAPFSLAYDVGHRTVSWLWGITLSYAVKLGHRVRIWNHGGIFLNACSIGDDVHIRQNTTIGVARTAEPNLRPVIGNRVDIGAGACILGAVTVADDSVVGANAVVIASYPPRSTLVGVPARPVHRRIRRAE